MIDLLLETNQYSESIGRFRQAIAIILRWQRVEYTAATVGAVQIVDNFQLFQSTFLDLSPLTQTASDAQCGKVHNFHDRQGAYSHEEAQESAARSNEIGLWVHFCATRCKKLLILKCDEYAADFANIGPLSFRIFIHFNVIIAMLEFRHWDFGIVRNRTAWWHAVEIDLAAIPDVQHRFAFDVLGALHLFGTTAYGLIFLPWHTVRHAIASFIGAIGERLQLTISLCVFFGKQQEPFVALGIDALTLLFLVILYQLIGGIDDIWMNLFVANSEPNKWINVIATWKLFISSYSFFVKLNKTKRRKNFTCQIKLYNYTNRHDNVMRHGNPAKMVNFVFPTVQNFWNNRNGKKVLDDFSKYFGQS